MTKTFFPSRYWISSERAAMEKKTDTKTIIIGIVFALCVIFGCINIMSSAIPSDGDAEVTVTPLSLQIPGWEDVAVNTLCLEVSQDYPEEEFGFFRGTLIKLGMDISPKEYSFPFQSVINDIMTMIGVQVVYGDAQCDVSLAIEVTGEGRGANYGDIITKLGKTYCFTGSYVHGSLELSTENEESFKTTFSARTLTSKTITSGNCPDQPYDAPFLESSAEAITNAIVKLWGPEIATVIKKTYFGDRETESAMTAAAKQALDNQGDNTPTELEPEPTTKPLP